MCNEYYVEADSAQTVLFRWDSFLWIRLDPSLDTRFQASSETDEGFEDDATAEIVRV